jgi:hypothetical protein
MSTNLSIQDVLASLEAKVAHLTQQVDLHTRQEAFHKEQREQSAVELEPGLAAPGGVPADGGRRDRDCRRGAAAGRASDDGPNLGGKPMLSRLVSAVIADKRGDEPFNATQLAQEIDRRYGKKLGRRVEPRSVASQLRRLLQRGKIHQSQKGQAYREAVFTRERPKR